MDIFDKLGLSPEAVAIVMWFAYFILYIKLSARIDRIERERMG